MMEVDWKDVLAKTKANLEKAKEAEHQEQQPAPEPLDQESAKKVASQIVNRTY